MQITNEQKTRMIELIRLETSTAHGREHKLAVQIETENIKATFDHYIWVYEGDVHQFLTELDSLDRTRVGAAVLQDIVPRAFRLVFEPIDEMGHLSATVQIVREEAYYVNYSYEIKVRMEIDPTCLPRLRVEMLDLIK